MSTDPGLELDLRKKTYGTGYSGNRKVKIPAQGKNILFIKDKK
jgi:hypothetical protein